MIIDKRIIREIEKTNSKISEMLSDIGDIQEEQLSLILKEIERLKISKKKDVKKKMYSFEVEKKLLDGFNSFSKTVSKKQSFKFDFKSIKTNPFPKIQRQSEEDFSRKGLDDVEYEKVRMLRSISKKLDFKFEVKKEAPKKEEKGSGFNLLELFGAGGIGATALKYGKKYAGKTLRVGITLKSLYDLFGTIKDGYSEYDKYKTAGNDIKANDVLFRTLIGGSGNLMNAASGILPGPYALLFGAVGTFLEYTAEHHEEIINDKTNEIMQRERKIIELEDMVSKGNKNNILQLRPSGDYTFWEYKNYASDDWEPLIDQKTRKPLSMVRGQDRIIPNNVGNGGIQTYKLRTDSNGIVDLVVKDGVAQIKIGDSYSSITTREKGGNVNKGKTYLVGEKGKEAFVSSDRDYRRKKYDKDLKKVIDSFELKKAVKLFDIDFSSFFSRPSENKKKDFVVTDPFDVLPKPIEKKSEPLPKGWVAEDVEPVSKREIPKRWVDYHLREKKKMNLDFSKIPKDSKERLKMFFDQLHSEEAGYVNAKHDKGGATNMGVAQVTYDTYRDSIKQQRQDVAKITKDEALAVYDKLFYKKNQIDKIEDPRLAYAWFVSFVGNVKGAPKWKKQGITTLEGLMEARKNYLFEITENDSTQKGWLKGWLGREIRMQEMFKTYKSENTLSSSPVSVNVVKKDSSNSLTPDFYLNTLAPLLSEEVNKRD